MEMLTFKMADCMLLVHAVFCWQIESITQALFINKLKEFERDILATDFEAVFFVSFCQVVIMYHQIRECSTISRSVNLLTNHGVGLKGFKTLKVQKLRNNCEL